MIRNSVLKVLPRLLLSFAACSVADAESVQEGELKMALTFNFARYVEWPELKNNAPLHFCILENPGLSQTFTKLNDRLIGHHSISVKNVTLETGFSHCEVLVIDGHDRKRIALALNAVKGAPVLTIGELPDFIDTGGIINLYQVQGKYRFEINPYAAQRNHLQISARLLQLARIVGE